MKVNHIVVQMAPETTGVTLYPPHCGSLLLFWYSSSTTIVHAIADVGRSRGDLSQLAHL
jgi:hypothetical protein